MPVEPSGRAQGCAFRLVGRTGSSLLPQGGYTQTVYEFWDQQPVGLDDARVMKTAVTIWFACSVAVPVIENAILYLWLSHKGVSMVFALTGMPGYLDVLYARWCREHQKSPAGILGFRAIALLNLVIAAWAFYVYVASR